jgi:outer membrane protein assembly factor BamD (BamD/ComL family)
MNWLWPRLSGILELILCSGLVGWILWLWLKKSEDPARLISKWGISVVMLSITWWIAGRRIAGSSGGMDYATAFVVVIACAACGIVLALTWGSDIGGLLGGPLTSLFDGGDLEVVPAPFYSIAQARRKQGKYLEAVAELRKQLARFPGDFTGMLMLAEVQAEELNDLAGAQSTIERLLIEGEPNPTNLSLALNRLADWQLRFGQDPDSARATLERVIQMFPESEQAYLATQRIAHLTTGEMLAEKSEPRRLKLGQYQENIGLLGEPAEARSSAEDPSTVAGNLVRQLEQHPQDNEAREKLAFIYAEHYKRLDLAADQLEQLLAQPNLPAKPAIHWLNALADLHLKHGGDLIAARLALQRIIDSFPQSAAAENAKSRMAHLQLELRSHKTSPAVKLGSYEQNIGLRDRPRVTD